MIKQQPSSNPFGFFTGFRPEAVPDPIATLQQEAGELSQEFTGIFFRISNICSTIEQPKRKEHYG